MTFQEWLNKALTEQGVSKRELATRVGVDHASVMAWTRGRIPSWDNAGQIADALGEERGYVRALAGYSDSTPVAPERPEIQEALAVLRELDAHHLEAALLSLRGLRLMQRASARRGGRPS